jgi:hypothetical protein
MLISDKRKEMVRGRLKKESEKTKQKEEAGREKWGELNLVNRTFELGFMSYHLCSMCIYHILKILSREDMI